MQCYICTKALSIQLLWLCELNKTGHVNYAYDDEDDMEIKLVCFYLPFECSEKEHSHLVSSAHFFHCCSLIIIYPMQVQPRISVYWIRLLSEI